MAETNARTAKANLSPRNDVGVQISYSLTTMKVLGCIQTCKGALSWPLQHTKRTYKVDHLYGRSAALAGAGIESRSTTINDLLGPLTLLRSYADTIVIEGRLIRAIAD